MGDPPTVPLLLIAGSLLAVQAVAVFRTRHQDVTTPELLHVMPTGLFSLIAAAGFGFWPVSPTAGPWIAAGGMVGIAVSLSLAAPRIVRQPTSADVARMDRRIADLDRRVGRLGHAVAWHLLPADDADAEA